MTSDILEYVLDDVTEILNRYLVLPEYGPETVALYIVQTHMVHHVGTFAPLLVLRSPEMRSGKTTTMDLIGELVSEPLAAANATPAALYRFMADKQPTVLLDEVDAFLAQKSEKSEAIRGIINAGHRRGRYSRVIRSDERGELQEFDVFGPKVLSGIGRVAATLQDRAITLTLRRKLPSEKVQRLRIAKIEGELTYLRDRIAGAAKDVIDRWEYVDPAIPQELSDRSADNWELLLILADVAGGRWPALARAAAITLSRSAEESESPKMQLLADIAEYLKEHDQTVIASAELVAYLGQCEHAPWPAWNNGRAITAQQVAVLLRQFQTEAGEPIKPTRISFGNNKIRGYRREWFADALARYLGTGSTEEGDTPQTGGTPELDTDNSIQDNDLTEFRNSSGFHPGRNYDSEQFHPSRNPEPGRNPANSLQNNDLRVDSSTVPPDQGVHTPDPGSSEDEPDIDPDFQEDQINGLDLF